MSEDYPPAPLSIPNLIDRLNALVDENAPAGHVVKISAVWETAAGTRMTLAVTRNSELTDDDDEETDEDDDD